MDRFAELDRLNALLRDPALIDFRKDMDAAESQISMHLEFQRMRGHPPQDEAYGDIFWISRSAVVTSFSALDRLVHSLLASRLILPQFERIRYRTFQSSTQIGRAMTLVGFPDAFEAVARIYSKDLMTAERLQKDLDSYYIRKNRITHHADSDDDGRRMKLSVGYAHECCKFIGELGVGLHSITFGT